jgi:hypothetical protein
LRIISRASVTVAAGVAVALAGGLTALAVSHGHTAQASTANAAAAAGHVTPTSLRVRSVSPADGTSGVSGTSTITVTYDQPVPAGTAFPRLSPDIPGSWQRSGDSLMFRPATGFAESTRVRVHATESDDGKRAGYASAFTTGRYSTLRLQEVLAELGYLPLTWRPAVGAAVPEHDAAAQLAAAYTPPPGTFTRRNGYPGSMYGFWQQGSANVMDSGAIAGFEDDHGLAVNGDASPAVWAALLKAAASGDKASHGYSYAIASESSPESLTIWHDGRQVFYSPANTGIPQAPTALGTFFVYEKLPFQIMQGTNPDGSAYSDPVEWVSYFNGGDAVHYFPRGSYGWPQSLGCVELPWSTAEEAYGDLPYGTMVTVAPLVHARRPLRRMARRPLPRLTRRCG